jgi:hypothetical protein
MHVVSASRMVCVALYVGIRAFVMARTRALRIARLGVCSV